MNMKTLLTYTTLLSVTAFSHVVYADNQWPDLPTGFKDGVGAQVGSKVYVGLGSLGKSFYVLDLNSLSKGWQKIADFSGAERSGATASVIGNDIYLFGGSGKAEPSDPSPILFDSVYRYDTKKDSWEKMNTTSPVGLLGASSYSPDNRQILFFGGYNKAYFDRYLRDISTTDKQVNPEVWQRIVDDYMGMKPTDYKWNRNVISYLPEKQEWRDLGMSPYLPNCGSATVIEGNKVTLISGEIKPGLRTAEVKQYEFGMDQPWQSLLPLPAPQTSNIQEGVAGAFSGKTNGVTVVAGGANFHGAKQAFENGKMFAHEGLPKAFNSEIYVEKEGIWSTVNSLPEGLAYGASFTTSKGVLIVGGEKSGKEMSHKVYMLAWNGSTVEVID